MIQIKVNDEPIELSEQTSLTEVLIHLGYQHQSMAVALNGKLIPKSLHEQYRVQDQDILHIVMPMCGG
jgi:thiamine biosynthesis protein ThiS